MATIVSNNGQTRWEKPLSTTDSVSPQALDFVSGDFPPVEAFPVPVVEGDTIVPGMVLARVTFFDGPLTGQTRFASRALTETLESVSIQAGGVAVSGIASAGANQAVLAAHSGVFDPDSLDWGPSVPSEEWKLAFFEYHANIVLRKRIASAP